MMPRGMFLKSEGFASDLYDPGDTFTLAQFCRENGRPYEAIGLPVSLETFVAYGTEFQKRLVPHLDPTAVTDIKRTAGGFEVTTAAGETVPARRVVIATGITSSAYLPPALASLPRDLVSHTSDHADLGAFRDRRVLVLGGGSSAVDTAALLHEAGARPELVVRAGRVAFHERSVEPRPLLQRLLYPRSGLGVGWRSRLCADAPMVFHALPEQLRLRAVKRHLGPASGWFVKDQIVGKVPMHLGVEMVGAAVADGKVHLKVRGRDGERELIGDHLIAGTGYRPALQRLQFLDGQLRGAIAHLADTPILSQSFESSVPGLYFTGLASANAFGPLMRFALGAKFTAKRLTRALARHAA